MRNAFYGYYPPTAQELETLWLQGTVVFDTNVLLNLYRLPDEARIDFLKVFGQIQERLWIPHQVALEFQTNRITVISEGRRSIETTLARNQEMVANVRKNVEQLQLEKRGLGIEPTGLLKELEEASKAVSEAVQKVHLAQLDISSDDPIRSQLDVLFEGRVGDGPKTQEDLDLLVTDGRQRYDDEIPPGYKDADKGKNPNDATFIFDGLRYQREFGDLIVWRQLIAKAKEWKAVLFVTSDRKEDWWWRSSGKTMGPHPSLLREMRRSAPNTVFWMYTSDAFLEQAGTYLNVQVKDNSVAEVKQVATEQHLSLALESRWHNVLTKSRKSRVKFPQHIADDSSSNNVDEVSYLNIASTTASEIISQWLSASGLSPQKVGPQSISFDGASDGDWMVHVIGGLTSADTPRMRQEFYRLRLADALRATSSGEFLARNICFIFVFFSQDPDYVSWSTEFANSLEIQDLSNVHRLMIGHVKDNKFVMDIDRRHKPGWTRNLDP